MDHIWPNNVNIIDHWLATRVMDYKYCDRMFCYHWGETLKDSISKNLWKPSTNLVQCKLIWDYLATKGYSFCIRNVPVLFSDRTMEYSVRVVPSDKAGNEHIYPQSETQYHSTLEGALCLTFLEICQISTRTVRSELLNRAIEHERKVNGPEKVS